MANPILDMLQTQEQAQQAPATGQGLPTSMDDPRMAQAKEYVQTHGGDPKAAFYQLCREKMLNPATILNSLLGR